MNKFILTSALTIGSLLSSPLFATSVSLTEWGTLASVVSGSCPGNSCTPDDVLFGDGINSERVSNGYNQTSTATGLVTIPQGSAKASAAVTGGFATPELKAIASSADGFWMGAGAYAIQGYEYLGADPMTISLDIHFDGTITNPDNDTATGFGVGMYLFSPEQLGVSTSTTPDSFLGFLALYADAYNLAANQIFEFEATQDGSVDTLGQISIDLISGQQFYLAGGILASAGGVGAEADAFSTLRVDFNQDYTGLLSTASIPIPAGGWLFISALLGLFGTKKFNLYDRNVHEIT